MSREKIILYAEDDLAHATLVNRAFSACGPKYKFLRFDNGKSLLEYLQQLFSDALNAKDFELIVFLDINMPQMNGIEVLKSIKSNSIFKNIPVLILTSSNCPDEVKQCFDNGCEGYFTKPTFFSDFLVLSKEMIEKIENLLDKSTSRTGRRQSVVVGLESIKVNNSLPNCWELSNCGRETDGEKSEELGECPVAKEGMGHSCWAVAGTLCGGEVQGSFAQKFGYCTDCEIYKLYNRFKGEYKDKVAEDFPEEENKYIALMYKKRRAS